MASIYRYKLDIQVSNALQDFVTTHKFDSVPIFKEAWDKWIIANNDIIEGEMRRLENLGYQGDSLEKMYRSARYYYKDKSLEPTKPKKRRAYIGLTKSILQEMDKHIHKNHYKPSDGYNDFVNNFDDVIGRERSILLSKDFSEDEVLKKIKKTYKNRHFVFTKKNS